MKCNQKKIESSKKNPLLEVGQVYRGRYSHNLFLVIHRGSRVCTKTGEKELWMVNLCTNMLWQELRPRLNSEFILTDAIVTELREE